MAVVVFKIEHLEKATGMNAGAIIETLDMLGMPSTEVGGVIETEITPNRPDMLTFEGVVRAIIQFRKNKGYFYKLEGAIGELVVKKVPLRPFVGVAAVMGVKDSDGLCDYLIQAQEKLHETLGRKRKKVAIGVHNLDKITFPITYKEVKTESFAPLGWSNVASTEEMMETHEICSKYKHLVKKGHYPMLYDNEGVISFPPLINSERTKIDEKTANFFIDVTGTHRETVDGILSIFVTALADRGGKIFGLKCADKVVPSLEENRIKFSLREANKVIGMELKQDEVLSFLGRMGLRLHDDLVYYPSYRTDIRDISDVAEDILIAYGYNKIQPQPLELSQIGRRRESLLKDILIDLGFTETVGFFLGNKKKMSALFGGYAGAELENSLTKDLDAIRTNLISSLLENEALNKMKELPHRFFEVGRVYEGVEKSQLCFTICDEKVKIEDGIEVVKRIGIELGEDIADDEKIGDLEKRLFVWGWRFKGVYINGCLGVLKPEVLELYNISNPVLVCLIERGGPGFHY